MSVVKISIVVPIYNGLQYLEKLVSCLQESTFKDVEVLLIDDFSTDGSYEFLEHRINNDIKFKLIRRDKKSGNAVSAMKYILPYCKGEYFFYLSQDDFIDNDCLEKLYKKAIETNADAILPNMVWYKEGEDNEVISPPNNDYDCSLVGSDAFELSLDWKIHGFSLRKMKLLREVGFDDSYFVGDEITTRFFYFKSQEVVFCDTNFYYRVDNVNALTKKIRPNFTEFIIGDLFILEFIKNNYKNNSLFFRRYRSTRKHCLLILEKMDENIHIFSSFEKEDLLHRLNQLEISMSKLLLNNYLIGFKDWFKIKLSIYKLKKLMLD